MPNRLLHQGAVLSSVAVSTFGKWRGCLVVKVAEQPKLPITLYDMEGCPYCRLVREALTALHLDFEVRPCPRGGKRFRTEAERIGGKQQFPLLVDANTDRTLYESRDIIEYLFHTYGQRGVPRSYADSALRLVSNAFQAVARPARGIFVRSSRLSGMPLHLWSFEGSPYSRLVRERLTELELPYTLHNLGKEHWKEAGPAVRRVLPNPYVPREGGKRHAFWQAHGRVQVPFLDDPNTGAKLFDSGKIVDYLESTYATRAEP